MYGVGIGTKNEKKRPRRNGKLKKNMMMSFNFLKNVILFKRDNFYTCVIIYRFKCVTECFEML